MASSLGVGAPVSSSAPVASALSRGWGGATCCRAMTVFAMSVDVSDVTKNKAALSMYPMGR